MCKAVDRGSKCKKRERETSEECIKCKNKRRYVIASSKAQGISAITNKFLAKIKQGPDFTCTYCHRMMYRRTVSTYKPSKHSKASLEPNTEDGKAFLCYF